MKYRIVEEYGVVYPFKIEFLSSENVWIFSLECFTFKEAVEKLKQLTLSKKILLEVDSEKEKDIQILHNLFKKEKHLNNYHVIKKGDLFYKSSLGNYVDVHDEWINNSVGYIRTFVTKYNTNFKRFI